VKKTWRIALWVVGILLVLFIIILALVPSLAENYIEKNDLELIGREIEIDDIDLNYFNGQLVVKGFDLKELESDETFVSFDDLLVDLKLSELLDNSIFVEKLRLNGLFAQVLQQGERFNFDDLLSLDSDTTSSSDESGDMRLTLADIECSANRIVYRSDLLPELKVDSLRLTCPLFSDTSERVFSEVSLHLASGGNLFFDNEVDLEKAFYKIHMLADGVNLSLLKPYCDPYIRINEFVGNFNSDFAISGSWEDTDILNLGGEMEVSGFKMTDQRGEEVLSARKLAIDLDSIQMKEGIYNIDKVIGKGFYCLYEMDETSDNWTNMLIADTTAEYVEDTLATEVDLVLDYDNPFALLAFYMKDIARSYKESDYRIGEIDISESAFDFNDYTTSAPFRYELSEVTLHGDSLDSQSETLTLRLASELNRAGTLDGYVRLFTANLADMDVYYEIRGTDLSPFSPYTGDYIDYPIITGALEYVCDTKIRDGIIVSSNVMTAENFEWGDKVDGDAPYNLPVKLAVSLLKDLDGNIELDVPIEGDLKDPNFKLGKVIWNTVKNIILKVATAPYRILARTFSIKEDRLKEIHFGLLERELNKDHQKQMAELAKVLAKKPDLNVEFKRVTRKFEEAEKHAIEETKREYLFGEMLDEELSKDQAKELRAFDVRDSLFGVWITERVPAEEKTSPVQRKCLIYYGEQKAIDAVDKINAVRGASTLRILKEDHAIAEERIRFKALPPDSLKTSRSTAVYEIGYWVDE
jgi:hypothetical protein